MVQIDKRSDLIPLHRALLQAKFCSDPWDRDIPKSDAIANLSRRVVRELMASDVSAGKGDSQWKQWLELDSSRREWKLAIRFARQDGAEDLMEERLRDYIKILLAPFSVDDKTVELFITELKNSDHVEN